MKIKNSFQSMLACTIQSAMLRLAELSVGKSYPFGVHEVEIPEEVRQWAKDNNKLS